MKQLVYIFTFIFISLLGLSANAELRERIRASDYGSKVKFAPEIFELKGIIKSEGSHKKNCGVDLEFVESETGKRYSVSGSNELERIHCEKEKNFLVTVKAEKSTRFLFWGDRLKVLEFQLLEELEAQPHIQVQNQNKRESLLSRQVGRQY